MVLDSFILSKFFGNLHHGVSSSFFGCNAVFAIFHHLTSCSYLLTFLEGCRIHIRLQAGLNCFDRWMGSYCHARSDRSFFSFRISNMLVTCRKNRMSRDFHSVSCVPLNATLSPLSVLCCPFPENFDGTQCLDSNRSVRFSMNQFRVWIPIVWYSVLVCRFYRPFVAVVDTRLYC